MPRLRLIGLAVVCALVGSLAQAQGLGEAAAREKKRREEEQKKRGSAKVVTNDELVKVGTSEAPQGSAANETPQPLQEPQPSDHRSRGEGSREGSVQNEAPNETREQEWRRRAGAARQNVMDAESHARELDEKAGLAFGQLQRSTDTNEMMRLREEIANLNEQIEQAKAQVAAAQAAIRDLEEEARKASVPSGWLR